MRTVTSKDGTTIAYEQSGVGHPVILVMGALGVRYDPTLAALLAQYFTVINYERQGNSGDTPLYAVRREVKDISTGALAGTRQETPSGGFLMSPAGRWETSSLSASVRQIHTAFLRAPFKIMAVLDVRGSVSCFESGDHPTVGRVSCWGLSAA